MIKFYDPFYATKLLENNKENKTLIYAKYNSYFLTYTLAAEIWKFSTEQLLSSSLQAGAKAGTLVPILLTLTTISTLRLRAEALNKVNLARDSAKTIRHSPIITNAYEIGLGVAIQLPYILIEIAIAKIKDEKFQSIYQTVFPIIILVLMCVSYLAALMNKCSQMAQTPIATHQAPMLNDQNLSTPFIVDNNADIEESKSQNNDTIKLKTESEVMLPTRIRQFLLFDLLRTSVAITGVCLQTVGQHRNNTLLNFLGFSIMLSVFIQKDVPAAYLVGREMFKKKWEDILAIDVKIENTSTQQNWFSPVKEKAYVNNPLKAGNAAAMTNARNAAGITTLIDGRPITPINVDFYSPT